jgi:hypothetical protein
LLPTGFIARYFPASPASKAHNDFGRFASKLTQASSAMSAPDSEKALHESANSIEANDSKESHNLSTVEIDPEAERRLVRKLDWILLPLFTLICEHLLRLL